MLSDFSAARFGDIERTHVAGCEADRSPEAILQMPWSYPLDI